jgi:Lipocalin-like domain
MKIRSLVALAGLTISSALPTFAQQASDLVGSWTLVSITLEKDGKKTDFYGPNPQGQLMYDATGHFSVIITRSDLPKFSSNNRETGTAEENKAIVQGSLAYFGTYSVSETDKTITSHVESSTFPNWNGADRKTSLNISGDELSTHVISGPLTSIGTGVAYVVWKRAK